MSQEYEDGQTIIEWKGPDYVPKISSIVLISVYYGALSNLTWQVEPGSWDDTKKTFSVWLGEDDGWQAIEKDKIQCWAFWPHPPGAIPEFANRCFKEVVKI